MHTMHTTIGILDVKIGSGFIKYSKSFPRGGIVPRNIYPHVLGLLLLQAPLEILMRVQMWISSEFKNLSSTILNDSNSDQYLR